MEQTTRERLDNAPLRHRLTSDDRIRRALKAGSYQHPYQQLFALDMNTRANDNLPVPPSAVRFQTPCSPPFPPINDSPDGDPNHYYWPDHRKKRAETCKQKQ